MQSLYDQFENTAKKAPHSTAVVFYGKRYSYSAMLDLVARAAAGFASQGIGQGDVVTLCLPNTPSAMVAFYALNRIGAVVGLVHPYTAPVQLCQNLEETNSKLLIVYDLYLRDKGHLLHTDVPVLASRCDYFMSRLSRFGFSFINRKKPRLDQKFGRSFEDFLSLPPSTTPPVRADDNRPAVYLPSGGTSGIPKVIKHNNKVFVELCAKAQYFLSEPLQNYKTMYSVLPIFHGFGLCMNMHMSCVYGLKTVMSIRFSPRAMAKAIKKEGVHVVTGVPAMYSRLLRCKQFLRADLSAIKDCFVGGDSAPQGLVQDFDKVLRRQGSNAQLHMGYGLAETVAVCVVNCKNKHKISSAGYPLPGTEIMIVGGDCDKAGSARESRGDGLVPLPAGEVGEIALCTGQLMMGYLGGGETIAEISGKRWLLTGDLGYLDGDGFLYFKQRAKNVLKVSGVPVYPCEIEAVAESVTGVRRAAAIGIPDERWGQAVKLFVETDLAIAQHGQLKQQIAEQCNQRLMKYAHPKAIEICSALLLNDVGKVDRQKLK